MEVHGALLPRHEPASGPWWLRVEAVLETAGIWVAEAKTVPDGEGHDGSPRRM